MKPKAFITQQKIVDAGPGFQHIAESWELRVEDPIVLMMATVGMTLRNNREVGKDFRFLINVCNGAIDWSVRDPAKGDRVCTAGSFRADGTPIVDGLEDVYELGM